MPRGFDSGTDAIAHARDLLSSEDRHLTPRLDDVERATSAAELDVVLALLAEMLSGRTRLRAPEYRKLAAVQTAARARRSELAAPPVSGAAAAAVPIRPPA